MDNNEQRPLVNALLAVLIGIYGLGIFMLGAIGLWQGYTLNIVFILLGVGSILLGAGLWIHQFWARAISLALVLVLFLVSLIDGVVFADIVLWGLLGAIAIYYNSDGLQAIFSTKLDGTQSHQSQ